MSGGQTGVDRAALDVAIEIGIDCGGYVPAGRTAEDGPIPMKYSGLVETNSTDPAERTRLNVETSDVTLVIGRGPVSGGTALTIETARKLNKPLLVVDLHVDDPAAAARRAKEWLKTVACRTLNVAGPRGSEDPGIYEAAAAFLRELLRR